MALLLADLLDAQVPAYGEIHDGGGDIAVAHLFVANEAELGGPNLVGRREVDGGALVVEQADAYARSSRRGEGNVGGGAHGLAIAADRIAEYGHATNDQRQQRTCATHRDGVAGEGAVDRPAFLVVTRCRSEGAGGVGDGDRQGGV